MNDWIEGKVVHTIKKNMDDQMVEWLSTRTAKWIEDSFRLIELNWIG